MCLRRFRGYFIERNFSFSLVPVAFASDRLPDEFAQKESSGLFERYRAGRHRRKTRRTRDTVTFRWMLRWPWQKERKVSRGFGFSFRWTYWTVDDCNSLYYFIKCYLIYIKILYYTVLCYTILYYAILYCTMLYYTTNNLEYLILF